MDFDALMGVEWIRAQDAGGNSAVQQSRQAIGEHLGWGDSWYSDEAGLGRLFNFLNDGTPLHTGDGRTRLALLDELAGATDEGRRVAWVDTVEREAYWSVPENRHQPPEFSEPYGMNYRYDNLYEVYEWEDPAEPGTWINQEDADARIVGRQQEQTLAGAAEPGYSEAVWDENWQMLYRLGPGGVYEYAYSDDQQTVRLGTNWLTYDEVMQGTAPSTEAASQPAPTPVEVQEEQAVSMQESPPAELVNRSMGLLEKELGPLNEEVRSLLEESLKDVMAMSEEEQARLAAQAPAIIADMKG